MSFLSLLRELLGLTSSPNVRLYCPHADDYDGPNPVLVGTEETDPAFRGDDDRVAYYECECREYHGFLWGPPAPVYVGDADAGQIAEHSLLSGGERVAKGRQRGRV